MKHNLLVWYLHSCRRDVFLEELYRGKLPNFQSLVDRGLFLPSAVVGGHFQKVSNKSEITGRPATSATSPVENLLNAARQSGARVGVVNDWSISHWAEELAKTGMISSIEDVYPEFLPTPAAKTDLEFVPELGPGRWLYWYRARSTHRPFSNLPLAFGRDGGFLEEIVNENPSFAKEQQRYALWMQDRWFGTTMDHLDRQAALNDTAIVDFSSHGTSLEGWLPLMGKVTKATVDHTAFNFHPNVSRSFAVLAGPGIRRDRIDNWVSIMDLKRTLARYLRIEDLGGSVYDIDWLNDQVPDNRILADITDDQTYSLYHPGSGWLFMSLPLKRADWMMGLPESETGFLAFNLVADEHCCRPRTRDFIDSPERQAFEVEMDRLQLVNRLASFT